MRNEDIVFLSEDDRRALILECRKKSESQFGAFAGCSGFHAEVLPAELGAF